MNRGSRWLMKRRTPIVRSNRRCLPVVPVQLHLVAEALRQKTCRDQQAEVIQGALHRGRQLDATYAARRDGPEVFAHGVVDVDLLQRFLPIPIERGAVLRPHVLRYLQRGADRHPLAIMPLRGLLIHLADEQPVHVYPALVQARTDPQLKVTVERVVFDRTFVGRIDLRVSPIHSTTESCLLLRGALGRDSEVGECGTCTLDRMPVHPAAFNAAFHHAVADAGPSELHDHVGRPGQ